MLHLMLEKGLKNTLKYVLLNILDHIIDHDKKIRLHSKKYLLLISFLHGVLLHKS